MPRQSGVAIEALEALLRSLGVLMYSEKRIGEVVGDDKIDAVIAACRAAAIVAVAGDGAKPPVVLAELDDTAAVLSFLDTALLPAVQRIIDALAADSSAPLPSHSSGHDTRSLVSMKNLIVVNCAIEVLFYWGVAAYSTSKLGFDLAEKQFPSKMLLSKDHVTGVHRRLQLMPSTAQVHAYISCLRACATHNSFKTWMLQRNMKRIILVFLALSTHKDSDDADIAVQAKSVLSEMKSCPSTQHLVVGELRWATRCQSDIKSASLRLFSDILMSKGGLYNVILGYIQNVDGDDPSNLKIALHVAMLISSVPSYLTKFQYFSFLCPELLETYTFAYGKNDIPLMRVCAMITIRVAKVSPDLADSLIIANWTNPLQHLYFITSNNKESSDRDGSIVILADEQALSASVGMLSSLLTLCPVSPTIIECFRRCSVGRLLIALYLEAQQSCRSSHLLRPLQELCQTYLSHTTPEDAAADVEAALLRKVTCDVCSAAKGGIELREGTKIGGVGSGRIRISKAASGKSTSGVSIADITGGGSSSLGGLPAQPTAGSGFSFAPGGELQEVLDSLSAAQIADIGGEGAGRMLQLAERSKAAMEVLLAVDRREGADSGSSVSSALFLRSMRNFLGIANPTPDSDAKAAASLVAMTMLSYVPMDVILKKCDVVLSLIAAYVETYASRLPPVESTSGYGYEGDAVAAVDMNAEEVSDGDETLEAVLNILESMLVLGKAERPPEEEQAFRQLLSPLETLSLQHPSPSISLPAANAVLLLITRAADRTRERDAVVTALSGQSEVRRGLRDELTHWRKEGLVDSPSPAMRGLAVRNLISYLHDRSYCLNPLSKEEARLALQTALSFLADDDSFVYLHALKAISVLATQDKADVTAALLAIFTSDSTNSTSSSGGVGDSITSEIGVCLVSMRRRAVIGDALSLVVRRHRETTGPLLPSIIAGCVKNLRSVPLPSVEEGRRLEEAFDLRALKKKVKKKSSAQGSEGNHGDAGDNNDNDDNDDNNNDASNEELDETDSLGEAVLLRQSAMSLLADAVAAAGWGAAKYLQDVLDIAVHVVSIERMHRGGVNAAMRRSAAFLLQHIVSSLQQRLLYIQDAGHHLKKIYATLKVIANDRDEVVRFQAERALAQIKDMVINELRPPPSPM